MKFTLINILGKYFIALFLLPGILVLKCTSDTATTTPTATTTTTTTPTTSTNNAPSATAIGHTVDGSNLPTHVWCKVSDPEGLSDIQSVKIKQTYNANTTGFTFTLYDNGTNGDVTASDGKYEYTFVNGVDARGFTTNPGQLWTCTVTDKAGATGTYTW